MGTLREAFSLISETKVFLEQVGVWLRAILDGHPPISENGQHQALVLCSSFSLLARCLVLFTSQGRAVLSREWGCLSRTSAAHSRLQKVQSENSINASFAATCVPEAVAQYYGPTSPEPSFRALCGENRAQNHRFSLIWTLTNSCRKPSKLPFSNVTNLRTPSTCTIPFSPYWVSFLPALALPLSWCSPLISPQQCAAKRPKGPI